VRVVLTEGNMPLPALQHAKNKKYTDIVEILSGRNSLQYRYHCKMNKLLYCTLIGNI